VRLLPLFVAANGLLTGTLGAETPTPAAAPERPRLSVETAHPPATGRTIAVPAGGDFQAALNAAQPGDVITLEAGATFTGPFQLPAKSGSGWIVVRTSALDGKLPPPGTRVDPSSAAVMPKLEAASGSVISTAPGAHHYRFIGMEIRPKKGVFLYNLVQLGTTESAMDRLPHHLVFDRCYLHGDPAKGTRRGIAMNSRDAAVIDSYLSDFKEVGADSQAIAGWNGPGPFKIENNYLEGAGENVMFGGATPTIPNLVPSDIEIRRNHFSKPLSWKAGTPAFQGTPWAIKNLFELKNARRVLVEGNLFEHNWPHAQNGFAILFTVRTEVDAARWAVVEDVLFINNVVRRSGSGVNILGVDDTSPTRSGRTRRITIKNTLFDEIGGERWGGGGRLFQLLEGTQDVAIEHTTAFHNGNIITADGAAHTRFVFRDNIALHNEYGIIGAGAGSGNPALEKYFPGATVAKNLFVGGRSGAYPRDNFFAGSLESVGYKDRGRGNYRLSDSSRYRRVGTDGKDIGVDFAALWTAMGSRLTNEMAGERQEGRR
jgi:hypothetical protein